MVFTSIIQLARNRGPDAFWRKRRIFKMSAHFVGRKRNCYSVAIRYVHRALVYTTKSRLLKKQDMKQLWNTRLEAACEEHGFKLPLLRESLSRMDVQLNRKAMTDLAIWEPRTFKSLVNIAWCKSLKEKLTNPNALGPAPKNVYLKNDD